MRIIATLNMWGNRLVAQIRLPIIRELRAKHSNVNGARMKMRVIATNSLCRIQGNAMSEVMLTNGWPENNAKWTTFHRRVRPLVRHLFGFGLGCLIRLLAMCRANIA